MAISIGESSSRLQILALTSVSPVGKTPPNSQTKPRDSRVRTRRVLSEDGVSPMTPSSEMTWPETVSHMDARFPLVSDTDSNVRILHNLSRPTEQNLSQ